MVDVPHGFDMAKVREAMDRETWETDDALGGDQVRRLYLGSVFSLTPSGKYYLPFACSNLTPCPACGGKGDVSDVKRRVEKKRARRRARAHRIAVKQLRGFAQRDEYGNVPVSVRVESRCLDKWRRTSVLMPRTCRICDGCGSREAHLDTLWRENAERAFEDIGLSLEAGEGDPCDLFAVEYRDAPEEDEGDEGDGEPHDNSDEPHDKPGYGVWNDE